MRRFLSLFIACCALLFAACMGAGFWGYSEFTKPGPLTRDQVVVIKSGSGVGQIAQDLKNAGIIDNPFIFKAGARFLVDQGPLKAGEFSFNPGMSARDVISHLQTGKTVVRRVTFAEGLTSFEIAQQLSETDGLVGDITVAAPEGSLLPETYHFSFGDSRDEIIRRMKRDMEQVVSDLWRQREPGLPLKSPQDAIILASIVEKETGVASERGRVAGVFINRLRKKIRLQSDPTVAYGVTNGKGPLGRPLRKSDLREETPFNTYVIPALPPTPIANPGRKALEAVMHPTKTDDLYFVADGTGGHVFAKTLREHNRNVARWRQIEKSRKSTK